MKIVFFMMVLLLLLSGCRIEWNLSGSSADGATAPSTTKTGSGENNIKQRESLSVFLNGDVEYNETQITLKLYTELQEGTILKVLLREYPADASLRDIANDSVKPVDIPIFEETIEVPKGDFNIPIERDDDKVYSLSVEFKPEIQSDALKEVYGPRGENIVLASNIQHYEYEGETMIGVTASTYIGFPPGWGYLE